MLSIGPNLEKETTYRHCHEIRFDCLLVPRRGLLHGFLDEAHRSGCFAWLLVKSNVYNLVDCYLMRWILLQSF